MHISKGRTRGAALHAAIAVLLVVVVAAIAYLMLWNLACDPEYWETIPFDRAQLQAVEHPNDPSARAVYGMHLWSRRRYEEAITELRALCHLTPLDSEANAELAQLYEAAGLHSAAMAQWRLVAKLAPKGSATLNIAEREIGTKK